MLNGKGSQAEINQRCEQISHHIKNATSDYEREKVSFPYFLRFINLNSVERTIGQIIKRRWRYKVRRW